MRNLMARLARRHGLVILVCAAVLGGFQLLMCAIVSTINLSAALEQLLALAPPALQAMVADSMLAGGTPAGLMAFGWNHPITHALAMAVPITLAARSIAGEVESGAIELILAQPISRNTWMAAHVAFGVAAIMVVALAGVTGTAVAQRLFGVEAFTPARLILLFAAFSMLQASVFAITLAFSAFGREAGRVAFAGVMVALLSYLVQAVAALWPRVESLGRYSLHHYYDPRALLVEGRFPVIVAIVLLGTALLAGTIAVRAFHARDLP
jgi:ABC-2 type transport system permease protein